jgi:methyl-accepting chemotaxis protein
VSNVEEQKKEIMKQNDELQKSREIERQRQWFNEGIATFSDILRKHKDNVDELANVILQNVVRHINANQGGIYLLNDEDQTKKFLELHASYAYDVKKFGMRRVEIGETLVGNTFKEKITRHLKELPADYLKIGSGLGSAQPRELLIVPLKVEEIIIGVMELASLSEFSDIQVNFLEKLSENITSQLFNAKISSKTAKLLEQSQRMAEEMHTREIQITKHIQELEANKEQALILKRESDDFIASIDNSIMRANFDLNGKLVYANEIFKERLNISSYEAKFMRFTDCIEESQRILYNEFWPRLTNESTPIQHLFSFISTGEPVDMITVLTPVADINGRVTKVLLLAIEKK